MLRIAVAHQTDAALEAFRWSQANRAAGWNSGQRPDDGQGVIGLRRARIFDRHVPGEIENRSDVAESESRSNALPPRGTGDLRQVASRGDCRVDVGRVPLIAERCIEVPQVEADVLPVDQAWSALA